MCFRELFYLSYVLRVVNETKRKVKKMKKQKTLKLNIDFPSTSYKSYPNVNLNTIPLDGDNRKSLEVRCSNGADVRITESNGRVYIDIHEHNLEYDELVTLDNFKERLVRKGKSYENRAYYVKKIEASTKTTQVNFTTYEK